MRAGSLATRFAADRRAANLLLALSQKADRSRSSKIICGVGRFTLGVGAPEERQILLDSTRVRVIRRGRAG